MTIETALKIAEDPRTASLIELRWAVATLAEYVKKHTGKPK